MSKVKSVISLFEEQVLSLGEKIATRCNGEEYSYQELNSKSNQLAHFLRGKGIKEGTLIGVYVHRNVQLMVTLLGILKSGAVYVPLDWTHPASRNNYIISQSGMKVILTERKLAEGLGQEGIEIICIDEEYNAIQSEPKDNVELDISGEQLAYVIYTSGSTGKPKGVAIKHSGLVSYLESIRKELDLSGDEKALATITITFDVSITELFTPLIAGCTVVIADEKTAKDGGKLRNLIEEEKITLIQTTSSNIYMLKDAGWKGNSDLIIAIGGEAWSIQLAKELLHGSCKDLWNFYGPTETTIFSTIAKITTDDTYIPLGYPINQTMLYVLDENHNLVDVGEEGELYIGGIGVAAGYLHNEQLTEERFISNPFHPDSGKMYGTGDIVKRIDEHNLMYVGRKDFQVKVQGYRIELGEIEKAIMALNTVEQAVVVSKEKDGVVSLGAYIRAEKKINVFEMRYQLEQLLPSYMIPNFFIQVDEYPMTPNGKVDRKVLMAMEHTNEEAYVAPNTEIEEGIVALWQELLGIERVGIKDNFLQLGGHSLMANRLVIRINKLFGTTLTLLDILSTSLTVEDMARAAEENLLENLSEEELMMLLNEVEGE